MVVFDKCPVCGYERFNNIYKVKWSGSKFVRCSCCKLIFQNPQEDRERTDSRYGDDYFRYELNNETNFFGLIKATLNDFNIENLLPAGSDVLEVGCATGLFLKYMNGLGYRSVGVELCKESAEYGIKTHNVQIINNRLENIDFADKKFDFVHFSHLIEHLNDPAEFLGIIYRLMKPGAIALITTPNSTGLFAGVYKEDWRCIVDDHLFLFNKSNLRLLLQSAGFKVSGIKTWGGIPSGAAPKIIKKSFDKIVKLTGIGDVVAILVTKPY